MLNERAVCCLLSSSSSLWPLSPHAGGKKRALSRFLFLSFASSKTRALLTAESRGERGQQEEERLERERKNQDRRFLFFFSSFSALGRRRREQSRMPSRNLFFLHPVLVLLVGAFRVLSCKACDSCNLFCVPGGKQHPKRGQEALACSVRFSSWACLFRRGRGRAKPFRVAIHSEKSQRRFLLPHASLRPSLSRL